jgi:hypothetical protein
VIAAVGELAGRDRHVQRESDALCVRGHERRNEQRFENAIECVSLEDDDG